MRIEWELTYDEGLTEFIGSEATRHNDLTLPRYWHCIRNDKGTDEDWKYTCFTPVWDGTKYTAEEMTVTESEINSSYQVKRNIEQRVETQELNVTDL